MVIVFGSINLDLIFAVPRLPSPGETILGPTTRIEAGGKGANQAVAAARAGARAMMVGAIGEDGLGERALQTLREAGVDLGAVRRVADTTGCAAITVDPTGANAIAVGSGANRQVAAAQVPDSWLGPDTVLVLQMEVPAAENAALIARARAAGCRIVLNLAPADRLSLEALRAVTVLVVNEVEAAALAAWLGCDISAAALRATLGEPMVVLTQGSEGAEIADAAGTWRQPAVAVEVVDTTAAGDCFVGVLAARLDRGETLAAAARQASRAAAVCCMRAGTQTSIPTAEETDRLTPER